MGCEDTLAEGFWGFCLKLSFVFNLWSCEFKKKTKPFSAIIFNCLHLRETNFFSHNFRKKTSERRHADAAKMKRIEYTWFVIIPDCTKAWSVSQRRVWSSAFRVRNVCKWGGSEQLTACNHGQPTQSEEIFSLCVLKCETSDVTLAQLGYICFFPTELVWGKAWKHGICHRSRQPICLKTSSAPHRTCIGSELCSNPPGLALSLAFKDDLQFWWMMQGH